MHQNGWERKSTDTPWLFRNTRFVMDLWPESIWQRLAFMEDNRFWPWVICVTSVETEKSFDIFFGRTQKSDWIRISIHQPSWWFYICGHSPAPTAALYSAKCGLRVLYFLVPVNGSSISSVNCSAIWSSFNWFCMYSISSGYLNTLVFLTEKPHLLTFVQVVGVCHVVKRCITTVWLQPIAYCTNLFLNDFWSFRTHLTKAGILIMKWPLH